MKLKSLLLTLIKKRQTQFFISQLNKQPRRPPRRNRYLISMCRRCASPARGQFLMSRASPGERRDFDRQRPVAARQRCAATIAAVASALDD